MVLWKHRSQDWQKGNATDHWCLHKTNNALHHIYSLIDLNQTDTRWDVSETKRQLYNRSAWNTIDVGPSAKQTTTTQSGVDGSFKIGGRL